jgi:ATP-dependent DNA helicase RecG
MHEAVRKLTKYLRLEEERGYDNRAVLGGLQKMLEPWQQEAEQEGVPEDLIRVVVSRLRDYPQLSPHSRQEVLRGIWNRLREVYPQVVRGESPAPATAPQAAPPSAQATPTPAKSQPSPPATLPAEPPSKRAQIPLHAPLTNLSGVGPKTANTLAKLGLKTLGDLLWHLPRRYDDYSQLQPINRLWYGQEVTVIGTVERIQLRPVRGGKMKLVEAVIGDGTGNLKVTWFNQPWIANRLKPGKAVVLSGKIDQYLGHLTMNNPEWEPLEGPQLHTNRIVPVYPLTAGVSGKWLRRITHSVVTRYAPAVPDPLPEQVRAEAGLLPLDQALQQVHFPDSWESLRQAQHRLAFDEMLLLQLGVLRQKRDWQRLQTEPLTVGDEAIQRFLNALPFQLTGAQQRALQAIRQDLASPHPMNRLLQGDVGSGKTVIAAAAAAITVANERQAAFLAPTSILAEQHFRTLSKLLPEAAHLEPQAIQLLLGSTPQKEKESIRQGLAEGSIRIVVGTHALLEEPVQFARLGLAVIDEQHRFGVNQRAALRAKGENPNLLVMTATPIPRSLALTIYGDLDLSVIDEMPPGRKPVETRVLSPIERSRAYQFISSQIEQGRQAFIIYPLVEESESVAAKAAVDEFERLQKEVFPQFTLGLLHGRMKAEEKEAIMRRFRAGEIQILVSTSVVEVGVDIPNASVMLIEGANRFGLAQLHQFRGRVGRSEHASYCLLIPDTEDETENERLKAMEATQDGFALAELDLEQRGPGEFFGTRQSGFADLRMARLTDIRLIEKARNAAQAIFSADPDLALEEHRLLAQALERFWAGGRGELS